MNLLELLINIPDPRASWKVKHSLSTLLFVTFCGVLCGIQCWSDLPDFCRAKYEWLSYYVSFEGGVPSAWTFRRIFTLLEPLLLEELLIAHGAGIIDRKTNKQIAIDGKSLRGSRRHNLECLHSISAVCHETGLVLAEMAVEKKSNEITAIPLLLDVLALKGNTVTIDAAGCQQAIADIIVNKKANYVLALKKNHPKFYERVSLYCHEKIIKTSHCLKDYFDDSRGRCVRRRYFSGDIRHIEGAEKWAGLKSVVALETIRSFDNQEKTTSDWKYYLSSHEATNVDLPDMIRNHWSIENKLHWVLDVHLGEDNDRKSERRSAKAFAVLKRIALNVVRTKDNDPKRSLRRRFKMAGWDNDYLLKLLV